ncbi:MAG: response regulator transcription factor [Candidatus Gastranaerophilales bacterium]|nr:response regulator transcription factor [Candidatus Gastranaerophilales bacterium]
MKNKLKILLVEDHALTRFGLKTTLESVDFVSAVIESEDGESAVALAQEHQPDLILMDLGLSGIDGIQATKQIKSINKGFKIIILTSHNSEEEILEALKVGANAYCLKDITPQRLLQVIETVAEGAAWLDPSIAELVLSKINSAQSSSHISEDSLDGINLTERESQVLKLIVDGLSNAEIAERICVSIHTAKAHVCNILQKLSVEDRTQAAIKALKYNIV